MADNSGKRKRRNDMLTHPDSALVKRLCLDSNWHGHDTQFVQCV